MLCDRIKNELMINDKLVPKRCTEAYLTKIGILDDINTTNLKDISYADKCRSILQGITETPKCRVCDNCTKMTDGKWQSYCSVKCAKNCIENKTKASNTRLQRGLSFDLSKDFLIDNYIIQKKTINKIAVELDVAYATVSKQLKIHNIIKRSHSEEASLSSTRIGMIFPPIWIDEMLRLYDEEKWTVVKLSHKFACHPETIRRQLVINNVDRRNDRQSSLEEKLYDFLTDTGINFIQNSRKIIAPYELDFFLPDYNIGIEVNGIYYHTSKSGDKPKDYHTMKNKEAHEANIRLYQFWQPDILNKFEVVKSMLLNATGKIPHKIDARKCTIGEVSFKEADIFYTQNHIQGSTSRNTKNLGLFEAGKLVSLVGYVVKGDTTIITRFCSQLYLNVRGGFSKLLKYIPGNKIRTYSHNDISIGNLYKSNGFNILSENDNDMWYTDYNQIFNRQRFMKNKLRSLEHYSVDKTELQIMLDSGYDVLYKSGTKTWELSRLHVS